MTERIACGLLALVLSAFALALDARVSESAGDLKIRIRGGKKLTLHNWTLDGDTLRGTRDVWVEYEKVRQPEAIALSDVTLRDGEVQGDSLRTYLEAAQREAQREYLASLPVAPAAEPAGVHSPPPEPALRLRLRLHDSPGMEHEGTLLRSSPDSLWIVEEDSRETLRYARTSLLQVESYTGSTAATGKGALIGGGVGLATSIGLIAAYSSEATEGSTVALVLGTAVFTAGGAFLGAIVGSAIKKEKWVDASSLGFSFEASPGSMKMSMSTGR